MAITPLKQPLKSAGFSDSTRKPRLNKSFQYNIFVITRRYVDNSSNHTGNYKQHEFVNRTTEDRREGKISHVSHTQIQNANEYHRLLVLISDMQSYPLNPTIPRQIHLRLASSSTNVVVSSCPDWLLLLPPLLPFVVSCFGERVNPGSGPSRPVPC